MAEKLPRLVPGVDVRKFKLDPMDGFLLTRIDGKLGPKELARETGLPDFQVEKTLEKLERLGVVERWDPTAPPPAPAQLPPKKELPQFASLGGDAKYDAAELEEKSDLPMEERRRVLDMYYRLDDLDLYTLLGTTKEADKKQIKRSYMALAAVMHPDRYFNKNLGSFKQKMEVLFGRVTEAHDTLVDVERRAEYDAYLAEVATTKGMEAMFERALEESRRAAAAAEQQAMVSPAATTSPAIARPSTPAGPVGPSAAELQARREALARRLTGGSGGPPRNGAAASSNSIAPPSNPRGYSSASDAVEALKRRYEERIDNATTQQAKKYVKAAEDSLMKNDVVGAASSLHIATKFAPEDAQLAMRYQEVRNQADKLLAESYAKQAAYEERSHHWPEAAKNWQKVAKIRVGDPNAHARAAHCLFMAPDGDLHDAAEHAKVALAAEPQTLSHHVTMAEIYLKAGKTASAKKAAETGLALDNKNAVLLGIVKKATKT